MSSITDKINSISLNQTVTLKKQEIVLLIKELINTPNKLESLLNLVDKEDKQLEPPQRNDKKKAAEEKRVDFIIKSVNDNTPLGLRIKEAFFKQTNKKIVKMVCYGSRKDHYDIEVHCEDGYILKCEEKGTDTFVKDLSNSPTPWCNSVQRLNGIGNKFSSGIKYGKYWHRFVVSDPQLKNEYDIKSQIPTEEEWLDKDAFKCGDPTSEWGVELKEKYRNRHPGCSMNGKKASPKDYRIDVNTQFKADFSEDDKNILIMETQAIINEIMNEKDCWLQTCGNIDDNTINFRWWRKIEAPKIKKVDISYKQGSDILFHFTTEENSKDFKSILRFGKGTGFSNIRYDVR